MGTLSIVGMTINVMVALFLLLLAPNRVLAGKVATVVTAICIAVMLFGNWVIIAEFAVLSVAAVVGFIRGLSTVRW